MILKSKFVSCDAYQLTNKPDEGMHAELLKWIITFPKSLYIYKYKAMSNQWMNIYWFLLVSKSEFNQVKDVSESLEAVKSYKDLC